LQAELKNNAALSDDNHKSTNHAETESSYNPTFRHQRNSSMNDIQQALRILGLGVNATGPEIKQTYRDLAKIWHPDRFPNDPSLRLKAQDKLKEINGAYSILRDYRPRKETRTREEGKSFSGHHASPGATSEAEEGRRSPHFQSRPTPSNATATFKVGIRALRWACISGIVLAIGMIGYVVNQTEHLRRPHDPSKNPSGIELPREDLGSRVPSQPAPSIQEKKTTELANPFDSNRTHLQTRSTPTSGRNIVSSPGFNAGYFTVDSTQEEVLAVQGPPTEFGDRVFTYGNSKVYFSDGRVTSWDSSLSHPLKTRLLPSKPNMPNKGYFTVGSKKEEVLAVQGIPTGFTGRVFEYGNSKVYFSDGRVIGWDVQAGYPLEVRSVTTGQGSSGN
jgi:hypothetical protein